MLALLNVIPPDEWTFWDLSRAPKMPFPARHLAVLQLARRYTSEALRRTFIDLVLLAAARELDSLQVRFV